MTWADAIQTHIFWVLLGTLAVQIAALIGLAFYVIYTRALLKTAEGQITLSQNLLKAANDQAEGISKPCLTLASKLRDQQEAITEIYGAVGATVAKNDDDGYFVVQNVGNGLAIGVAYRFEPIDPPHGKNLKGNSGYLQNVTPAGEIRLPLPVKMCAIGHWEASFEFGSLGARRYRTTVTLKANVLTEFQFVEIDKPDASPK